MDQRREELKRLKKAYKHKKRGTVCVWRMLAGIFLLVALISAAIIFVPLLPAVILTLVFPVFVVDFLVAHAWLVSVSLGGSVMLFLLFMVLAGCGKRKLQKSKEFLDYRTMKNTLKAEKMRS